MSPLSNMKILVLSLSFALLAAAGAVGLMTHNETATISFVVAATTISALIAIGGLRAYMGQEMVDVREVYREERETNKRKLTSLKEEKIALEKRLIVALSRGKESSSTTIPEPGQHAAISIDGGMEPK
jgi:hypothetical protein